MTIKKKPDRFYDTPIGRLPSVTTILGQVDKSYALIPWAIGCMRKYSGQKFYQAVEQKTPLSFELVDIILDESASNYRKVQQEALDFGSEMHNLIEVYLKGKEVGGLLEALPTLVKPF